MRSSLNLPSFAVRPRLDQLRCSTAPSLIWYCRLPNMGRLAAWFRTVTQSLVSAALGSGSVPLRRLLSHERRKRC